MASKKVEPIFGDQLEMLLVDPKTHALFKHKGYKIMRLLGQGAFGQVYEAVDKQAQKCAIKVMNLSLMSESFREKFLPREMATLIRSRHQNLVEVWEIFRAEMKVFIIMEYAGGGDIANYLRQNPQTEDRVFVRWFAQITNGLAFLHINLLCSHRDIKLDNMLLSNDLQVAKLTDFGFAKKCAQKAIGNRVIPISCLTFCGTSAYKCPQILRRQPYNGFKADVWSMSVSLYVMLHRRFPFHYQQRDLHISEIDQCPEFIRGRIRKDLPNDAISLFYSMFEVNERLRADIQTVLYNPWLCEANQNAGT